MVPSFPALRLLVAVVTVLLVCAGIQPRPLFAAVLADGDWVVKESCGENKAGKDEAAKKPFSWDIELSIKAGHVIGSKHSVNPDDKTTTDITYEGTVGDSTIKIAGTGKRSNLPQPWTYAYNGKLSGTDGPQLTGDMMMRLPNGQQFKLRSCTLSFLMRKDVAAISPTSAGSLEDMRIIKNSMTADFQKECASASGQAAKDVNSPEVGACVLQKYKDSVLKASLQLDAPGKELKLLEFKTPLAKPNVGPEKAKGVIYFVSGYSHAPDDFEIAPYLLKSLADDGWDVIFSRLPQSEVDDTWPGDSFQVPGGTAFVKRRVAELKSQGYKRIVLAGFSWGGWVSLAVTQSKDSTADALLLLAPAVFGHRVYQGKENPFFDLNIPAFKAIIRKVATPSVVVFPTDPIGEPDGFVRGVITEISFLSKDVPHLVIANPPGFSGHYAPWLPFFDFAYGKCIAAFLEKPSDTACATPPISDDDFRSILSLKQIQEVQHPRISKPDVLVGRKFAAYVLRDEDFRTFNFKSASQRVSEDSAKTVTEAIAFRNSAFCVGSKCSILVHWSNDVVLEFESDNGNLKAWWIAEK